MIVTPNNIDAIIKDLIYLECDKTNSDFITYTRLNEAGKKKVATNITQDVAKQISSKLQTTQGSKYDNEFIDRSEGDVGRLQCFTTIKENLIILKKTIQKKHISHLLRHITVAEETINHLIGLAPHFKKAYMDDNQIGQLLYRQTVKSLILYVSYLDANMILIVDNGVSDSVNTGLGFELDIDPEFVEDTNTFKFLQSGLTKFNNLAETGKLNGFFVSASKSQNLTLTSVAVSELVLNSSIAVAGFISIILLLREFVYYFYHLRVRMADYLEYQATLIEIDKANYAKNDTIRNRQEKHISFLRTLSEKINVDLKIAQRETRNDLKKDPITKGAIEKVDAPPKIVNQPQPKRTPFF